MAGAMASQTATLRHAGVCVDDFYRGLPALPGAASDCEVHPAVVWRRAGGLDDLHVVFPGIAAGRLRLCAFPLTLAETPRTGLGAFDRPGRGSGTAADHSICNLETGRN